jgi:hypothetical protein
MRRVGQDVIKIRLELFYGLRRNDQVGSFDRHVVPLLLGWLLSATALASSLSQSLIRNRFAPSLALWSGDLHH